MAIIIESPGQLLNDKGVKIFLAGGIANCPDWQSEIIELLKDEENVILYNPRRANFPMDDPNVVKQQITWEYDRLKEADIIIFWFSRGSLNPIVLYELGMWGNSRPEKISIIGCDPGYERIQDVEIQSRLAGNNEFHSTLNSIANQVKKEAGKYEAK